MASKNSKEKKEQSSANDEKVLTKYDRKVMRRNEEEQRRKKKKMAVRGTGIVILAACVVAAAFLLISTISKSLCYIKVDDQNISKTEFEFYYNRNVNANASTYAMYYGLDTSQPLDKQNYTEDLTWKDFFDQMAVQELIQVKALVKEARENKFDGDVDKELAEYKESIVAAAKEAGKSEDDYYKELFGASKDRVEEYMKEYVLASLWTEKLSKDNEPSEEEIENYYGENKETYDYVNYYVQPVSAEGVSIGQSSEDEVSGAVAEAHVKAEEGLKDIEQNGGLKEHELKNSISSSLTEWLFDEERKAGDTTVVDDINAAVSYALKFVERGRDESPTKDIYCISSQETSGSDILKEWEKTDKSQEEFIKLVKKYSEGTEEDGLLEAVTESDAEEVDGLKDWLFDAGRKAGDVESFSGTDEDSDISADFVVYFKGEGVPSYKADIKSVLVNEKVTDHVKTLTDAVKLADPKHVLKYLEIEDKAGE